jgi:predicted  nucleic acid-binding Zn-ribbon protein
MRAPHPSPEAVLKAELSRQWRLLDLQALDTRIDQIDHRKASLPVLKELEGLQREASVLDADVVRARTAFDDVGREIAKSEADVQLVRDRAARNQARLDSGQGTAKDLQALQHEIASLARRQSELEDLELEVMERAEGLEATLRRHEAARADLASRIADLETARDKELGELDAEREQVVAERAQTVPGVGEDLLALYDKIRASSGGLGAAALTQRRCGGCRLELNHVDLGRITAAPEDEVVRCEECRRILVRTSESGI